MNKYRVEFVGSLEELDPLKDNIDIHIIFDSGEKYFATLFTIANLQEIMMRHKLSGECAGGKYFGSINMLIVESLNLDTIHTCVDDIIQHHELEQIFARV